MHRRDALVLTDETGRRRRADLTQCRLRKRIAYLAGRLSSLGGHLSQSKALTHSRDSSLPDNQNDGISFVILPT